MKRNWELDELIDHFTLMPQEMRLVGNKTGETRLGFVVILKYFQYEGRFPTHRNEIPNAVVKYIAKQIGCSPELFPLYDLTGRTASYHRSQVREFWGFREPTVKDFDDMSTWLVEHVLTHDHDIEHVRDEIYRHFRELSVEPVTPDRIEQLIRSAIRTFEDRFFSSIYQEIPRTSLFKIDDLIESVTAISDLDEEDMGSGCMSFHDLKSDPGRVGLESVLKEIAKLRVIRSLDLPSNLFRKIPPKVLRKYRQRVATEDIRELRRHPEPIRYTLLAIFFYLRGMEITDNLIELLIQIIHRIGVRAERKVEKEVLNELKRVSRKNTILFNIADTALNNPDGVVREVIYPVVGEETLKNLVKELKHTGPAYREKVHNVIRASYSSHYRRMVPEILTILNFQSNNVVHRPVVHALNLIKRYNKAGLRYFPSYELVPIEGVIKPSWQELIVEKDDKGQEHINRINYEISALQALRDKLRCKEIWVVGANRYRNPDEDLPADFEQLRVENYKALNQPLEADIFTDNLKMAMKSALERLNYDMPKNSKVKITTNKGKGWISVSPLDPQPEPLNLSRLKAELQRRWPMTNLLDILKEADLRVFFTDQFKTVAVREVIDRETLQKRLILALYGLGTNTGLKRISAGEHGESYKDLLYIRRKFIHKDNLRNAIAEVVNAIMNVRRQEIWGEGTTSCASDSKKFGAWDQNLMTEWHIRYHGRGVMIYWHVEKNSACIYSQLKSCSSSEVAAMIEGLLRHCTDMEIEKNFVDTHGQSEVAFAFCHLLGFQLMPRLKAIHAQKLYRPETGMTDAYSSLQPVLTKPINWELIRQQYDQMMKYATALRLGTAETEAILKRFTKNNLKHPTYQALGELGKAVKTIFLCEYLRSEELRREINEGLNVIENWNSANSFIFFGKGGEIATNRIEDQEIAVLSLHLLQNCLVYVNTLMLQQILADRKWFDMMTREDLRALTPLFYLHVNPYGSFKLDMSERLLIENEVA